MTWKERGVSIAFAQQNVNNTFFFPQRFHVSPFLMEKKPCKWNNCALPANLGSHRWEKLGRFDWMPSNVSNNHLHDDVCTVHVPKNQNMQQQFEHSRRSVCVFQLSGERWEFGNWGSLVWPRKTEVVEKFAWNFS